MDEERRDFLLELFNENARIARTMGMTLSFDDEGRAHIRMPYNPGLDHAGNGIHGGAIATMLDNAGWFTCALAQDSGFVVTSDLSVHLLRAASKVELVAVGDVVKKGRQQSVAQMSCMDGEGRLIAHAVGTFINVGSVSNVWDATKRKDNRPLEPAT